MADEIHGFACKIPAGTLKSAPVTIAMPLNLYEVESIDVEVPAGPAGLMGFYLELSGQQWIPWEMGQWITWDNQSRNWPLTNQPTSSGWALVGYNTGTYDHTVTVRFHLNAVSSAGDSPAPSITIVSSPSAQVAQVL